MRTIRRLILGPNQTMTTETETVFEENDNPLSEGGDRILADNQVIVTNDDLLRLLEYDRKIANGELAEVRHGWWIVERDEYSRSDGAYSDFRRITCSECKEFHFITNTKLPPYCEECGAKMDRKNPAEAYTACADCAHSTSDGTVTAYNNANDTAEIIKTVAEGGGIAKNRVIAE